MRVILRSNATKNPLDNRMGILRLATLAQDDTLNAMRLTAPAVTFCKLNPNHVGPFELELKLVCNEGNEF